MGNVPTLDTGHCSVAPKSNLKHMHPVDVLAFNSLVTELERDSGGWRRRGVN